MGAQTLFDKYGGFSQISKIVFAFYDKVLESDEVGPFFDEIDMAKMVDHQTKFIASLLGGPASYSHKQLEQMHKHLAVTNAHFDELKIALSDTLTDFSVEKADIETIATDFESLRGLIVN